MGGFETDRVYIPGSSGIIIAYSHGYYGDYDHELYFSAEDARVNQHAPPPPDVAPYGVDEVATLSSWLVTVGLVCCIPIVAVTVRNRRSRSRRHGDAEET